MTKKELLEAIKHMPEDMEVMLYTGAVYRPIQDISIKKLWEGGKQKNFITLHPYPCVYAY